MRVAAAARRSLRRPAAGVAAALAAAGLLAGCTGGGTGAGGGAPAGAPPGAAAPVASTAPSPAGSAGTAGEDLSRGLLPADAFGAGARVVPVTRAQLQQHLAAVPGGLTGALAGVQVTPPECATTLHSVGAGLAGLTDLAGEGARTVDGVTAEALLTGAPVTSAVGTLQDLARSCAHVQVTSPHGTASVTLTEVEVPALGDGGAAVQATAVLTPAGRAAKTVSGLLAAVRDGDRLLLLGTAAPGSTAPDHDAFTSLLQQAFDTESHALG
jgi:hypothetical protein